MLASIFGLSQTERFLQLHCQTAVDGERVTRDERRLAGTEKGDAVCNVVGGSSPADRVLLGKKRQAVGVIFLHLRQTLTHDVTGGDCVHPDVIGAVLGRHLPGQPYNTSLCGLVDQHSGLLEQTVDRGKVDNVPAA